MRHYRYEVDRDTKQFSDRPLHDYHSHAADAFRYFALQSKRTGLLQYRGVRMTGWRIDRCRHGKIQITADISVEAYGAICRDIRRATEVAADADVDCDYYDGAQMSAEVMQRLKNASIPQQDSNLIKPTVNAVLGLEARSRTDYSSHLR